MKQEKKSNPFLSIFDPIHRPVSRLLAVIHHLNCCLFSYRFINSILFDMFLCMAGSNLVNLVVITLFDQEMVNALPHLLIHAVRVQNHQPWALDQDIQDLLP